MIDNLPYLLSLLLIGLMGCSPTPASSPTIFLAGNSTLAKKNEDRRPETGWGEMLAAYLDTTVTVHNYARNGRSTKSFRDEGLWDDLIASVRPGDYVFIEFGHNDSKPDTARYSSPEVYRHNLRIFVAEVQALDAKPVLMTPIVRRKFGPDGQLLETHGEYPGEVKRLADELDVPLIDLNTLTRTAVNRFGPSRSKELFLWLSPGEHKNYPDGVEDDTHLNAQGAKLVAGLVARDIERIELPLRQHLIRDALPEQ